MLAAQSASRLLRPCSLAFLHRHCCTLLPALASAQTAAPRRISAAASCRCCSAWPSSSPCSSPACGCCKRLSAPRGDAAGLLRIVAGTAVGPRERVVVVEVGDTWLVLGVAPGQVSALAEIPRARPAAAAERAAAEGLRQLAEADCSSATQCALDALVARLPALPAAVPWRRLAQAHAGDHQHTGGRRRHAMVAVDPDAAAADRR